MPVRAAFYVYPSIHFWECALECTSQFTMSYRRLKHTLYLQGGLRDVGTMFIEGVSSQHALSNSSEPLLHPSCHAHMYRRRAYSDL